MKPCGPPSITTRRLPCQSLVKRDPGRGEGKDPIGVPLGDERGDVHALEVAAEVRRPRRDAVERALGRGARGDVPAELHDMLARHAR